MRGKTASGFEFDVPDETRNDMELLEALTDLQEGDGAAMVPIARKILGKQKKALYDHLRTEDGRVPVDKVSDEILEIFKALKDGPKS